MLTEDLKNAILLLPTFLRLLFYPDAYTPVYYAVTMFGCQCRPLYGLQLNIMYKAVKCKTNLSKKKNIREMGLTSLVLFFLKKKRHIEVFLYKTYFRMSNLHTGGHCKKLYKPFSRLKIQSQFFAQRVNDEWNSLPNSVDYPQSL